MHWTKRLLPALGELFYPSRCGACDDDCEPGAPFCELCALTLEPIGSACAACGLPLSHYSDVDAPPPLFSAGASLPLFSADGAPARAHPPPVAAHPPPARAHPPPVAARRPRRPLRCLGCLQRPPPFSSARAPFQFGGALARAIRRLKWGNLPELARPLGRLLTGAATGDVSVPVPLHPKRLRARQFNQAALLALAARAPPVDVHALDRVRDTPPQSALGLVERRANVAGAFRARPERVRNKRVVLVDDVMTTGATVEACASALLDSGAAEVVVLTLARAMP